METLCRGDVLCGDVLYVRCTSTKVRLVAFNKILYSVQYSISLYCETLQENIRLCNTR
jgi:hypothetical protein